MMISPVSGSIWVSTLTLSFNISIAISEAVSGMIFIPVTFPMNLALNLYSVPFVSSSNSIPSSVSTSISFPLNSYFILSLILPSSVLFSILILTSSLVPSAHTIFFLTTSTLFPFSIFNSLSIFIVQLPLVIISLDLILILSLLSLSSSSSVSFSSLSSSVSFKSSSSESLISSSPSESLAVELSSSSELLELPELLFSSAKTIGVCNNIPNSKKIIKEISNTLFMNYLKRKEILKLT